MQNNLLVLQSDFGLVDGAVSAMVGVALEESPTLKIHHLTHDITPYNIFEGSYRLFQTVNYIHRVFTDHTKSLHIFPLRYF